MTTISTRKKALIVLGLSEEDIKTSHTLFQQLPIPPTNPKSCRKLPKADPVKVEQLLGYATLCLQREKALKVLGTSEEDIEVENSKNLAALGQSGRRRSYLAKSVGPEGLKIKVCYSAPCLPRQRRKQSSVYSSRHSSGKKRSRRSWLHSTGRSTKSNKSQSSTESENRRYIDEMNSLKAALFQTQAELSNLENRFQQLEEKHETRQNNNSPIIDAGR
jgi:hypothetical protein